jgi:hypothetical protein
MNYKARHSKRIMEERKESDAYPASELEEDAEGREDDGDDDVDAGGRAHGRSIGRSPFLVLISWSRKQ